MAAESRFDQAGVHLLRWVYAGLLRARALALRLWTLDANVAQWQALTAAFPLIRRFFGRAIGFGLRQMGRSRRIIDRTLAELDRLAESGRAYLVGDTLTVADTTAAALLSPLACPDAHPIYGSPGYREAMRSTLQPWRDRPGLARVRTMYERHRESVPVVAGARAPAVAPRIPQIPAAA